MIKLITLDLDNTLWDVKPVLLRAEQILKDWVHQELPQAIPHYTRDNLLALRQQFVTQMPEAARLPTTLRKAILRSCFQQAGLSDKALDNAVEHAFNRFHTARNEIEFFPETLPLLDSLVQDFSLIALSNGNADVRMVGLGDYFDAHFSAESTGKPKPDPTMFTAALNHAGVQPKEALHIGDHPEEDIDAAQAVGYRTIWFNPGRKNWSKKPQPDREVSQLNQLVSTIREIMG